MKSHLNVPLLLLLTAFAALTVDAEPVSRCRCEEEGESFYKDRLEPDFIEESLGLEEDSVSVDDNGWIVIDMVKIVPREMCPPQFARHLRELKKGMNKKNNRKNVKNGNNSGNNGNSNDGNNGNDNVFGDNVFHCEAAFATDKPKRGKLDDKTDKFLTDLFNRGDWDFDETGKLVEIPGRRMRYGTIKEEEVDCSDLPLQALLNPRAVPFHCRCSNDVRNKETLPKYCLNRKAEEVNKKLNRNRRNLSK